jgi:hypothetical protein
MIIFPFPDVFLGVRKLHGPANEMEIPPLRLALTCLVLQLPSAIAFCTLETWLSVGPRVEILSETDGWSWLSHVP